MNFHAKNLVELLLRNNNIKQLWRGNKVIDLSYSVHLIKIPDFSSVPNLEILTLEGCVNLELLPRGIYKLKHLQTLSCNGCSKLERFPKIKGNMGKLRVLDLSGIAIMDLPSSISHLNGLQTLLLEDCSKLHKIPIHICHLSSLEVLDLGNCNIMEGGIPSDICHLSSLQKLNLEGGHFSCIPATINQLSRLKALNLVTATILNKFQSFHQQFSWGLAVQDTNSNHSQRSCDTRSAVEDTNTDAQRSCDGAMQNIDGNGVDAQDHEMDHMHRWLELLCKFVHWICCTRR
ncbi:unnamed protein product, partial [Vitis vinifera]|uniref:Disease resistance R13L4/SHOC-2-like LRR domain-containing protein n=1 Tax=Vitis vinifera TaxID=29760 RepID=D7TS50_VITVI